LNIAGYVRRIARDRTVRLLATARLRAPVFRDLVAKEDLAALEEIESATSGRLRAEQGGTDRLHRRELVYGVPYAEFINAAFSSWLPRALNRFNGPGRGAWYAALELATCVAEVSFHIERELANISDFHATVDYVETFASFIGNFVDLRRARPRPAVLNPNPAKSYKAGNLFADSVRAAGHYGIVYPSLRHAAGTCLVALVPHAVQSVRQGGVIRLTWTGRSGSHISRQAQ
jgi:RES domain-containing protein